MEQKSRILFFSTKQKKDINYPLKSNWVGMFELGKTGEKATTEQKFTYYQYAVNYSVKPQCYSSATKCRKNILNTDLKSPNYDLLNAF